MDWPAWRRLAVEWSCERGYRPPVLGCGDGGCSESAARAIMARAEPQPNPAGSQESTACTSAFVQTCFILLWHGLPTALPRRTEGLLPGVGGRRGGRPHRRRQETCGRPFRRTVGNRQSTSSRARRTSPKRQRGIQAASACSHRRKSYPRCEPSRPAPPTGGANITCAVTG
jgi:hypothetical protein